MYYVKVRRVWNTGTPDCPCYSQDGWFYSKIFAIDVKNNKFLVYDDGSYSSEGREYGFVWITIDERFTDFVFEYDEPVVTLCDDPKIIAELEKKIVIFKNKEE